MRNLKFSLDVQANALLCPNPTEWFERSYLQANIVDNFRTVPGVKESTKIAHNTFGNLIQSANCSWNATDTVLDAEDIDVCKLDVMVQVCQYDLESSFVSENMLKGDANWQESEFLAYYWSELQSKVAEELQILRWNGDVAKTGTALDKCDGYLVKLEDSVNYPGVKELTSFTDLSFDKDNIIGVLAGLVALLPEATISNQNNVRIYMSASNAYAYQLATLGLNHNFNYTGELELKFAGFKIAIQQGMDNDYIVIANKNSLVYAFDGEGDEKSLKIVNMIDTTVEAIMRTRIGMKVGFHILDEGNEVAYAKVGPSTQTSIEIAFTSGTDDLEVTYDGVTYTGTWSSNAAGTYANFISTNGNALGLLGLTVAIDNDNLKITGPASVNTITVAGSFEIV